MISSLGDLNPKQFASNQAAIKNQRWNEVYRNKVRSVNQFVVSELKNKGQERPELNRFRRGGVRYSALAFEASSRNDSRMGLLPQRHTRERGKCNFSSGAAW